MNLLILKAFERATLRVAGEAKTKVTSVINVDKDTMDLVLIVASIASKI